MNAKLLVFTAQSDAELGFHPKFNSTKLGRSLKSTFKSTFLPKSNVDMLFSDETMLHSLKKSLR